MRRQLLTVDGFARPEDFREFFKAAYGPTVAAYRGIADDPDRVAAPDREHVDLTQRFDRGTPGAMVLDWEYLLVTARVRGS